MTKIRIGTALVVLTILISSCTAGSTTQVTDYDTLLAALRSAGAQVEQAGEMEQPFLSAPGRLVKVNGVELQVFVYADAGTAEKEAGWISPDGSIITGADGTVTQVDWMSAPHFYRAGKLIVLYVGNDSAMLTLLRQILGQPFAG